MPMPKFVAAALVVCLTGCGPPPKKPAPVAPTPSPEVPTPSPVPVEPKPIAPVPTSSAMAAAADMTASAAPSKKLDDAIAWAQKTLTADGQENVHAEKVMVSHWERGDLDIQVVSPAPQK